PARRVPRKMSGRVGRAWRECGMGEAVRGHHVSRWSGGAFNFVCLRQTALYFSRSASHARPPYGFDETVWRSRTRCAPASTGLLFGLVLLQVFQQPGFIADGNAEIPGLAELGAGGLAGDDEIGVFGNAAGYFGPQCLQPFSGFIASELGQGSREHGGLAIQWQGLWPGLFG